MMMPLIISTIECDDDRDFFQAFYEKYKRLMYAEALKCAEQSCDAEDLIQESLEKIIDKLDLFRSLAEPQQVSYFLVTLRHHAINQAKRKHSNQVVSLDDMQTNDIQDESVNIEASVIYSIQLDDFAEAWSKLPIDSKVLLERKYLLHQSNTEMAAFLGIKPSSMPMRLTRARREIRNAMQRDKQFD